MPRPPEAPEIADAALKELLCRIHGELQAERSAAKARHEAVLERLDGQKCDINTILDELQSKQKRQSQISERTTERAAGLINQINDQGTDPDIIAKTRDRARRLSEIIDPDQCNRMEAHSMPSQDRRVVHLSKYSKFQFGTKWKSEESFTKYASGPCYMLHLVRTMVRHDLFEVSIACIIMSNALVMGFEAQYEGRQVGFELNFHGINDEAHKSWHGARLTFDILDWCFGTLFVLEALVKILTYCCGYFCDLWNLIDITCVLAFIVDKLASAFSFPALDAQTLRLVRLLRFVRLIRLLRTMEKLDVLYIMTTAIKGMRMIVVWAVALLTLILMTCALFLSQFLQSTYFDGVGSRTYSSTELEKRQQVYRYFGTFTRCMLSMFELTLANWPTATRILTEEVSEWFAVICVLHKISIGFAVIGVINGVILQETFKVAHTDDMVMVRQKRRAKRALKRKMHSLFESLDVDQSGDLEFQEFMIIAAQPEVKLWLESLDLEVDDLLTLFMLIDADGNGHVTLEELLANIPRIQGNARSIDMLAVRKGIPAFQLFEDEPDSPDRPDKVETPSAAEKRFKWKQRTQPSRDMIDMLGHDRFAWTATLDTSEDD